MAEPSDEVDPAWLAFVQALARRAAREDHEKEMAARARAEYETQCDVPRSDAARTEIRSMNDKA